MKKIYFLLLLVPIALLFSSSSLYIENQLEKWIMERVETELFSEASTLTRIFDITPVEKKIETLDPLIDKLAIDSPYRITIIRDDGVVLADSWITTGKLHQVKNHTGRKELLIARTGKPGTAIRHSSTVKTDLLYLAIPFNMHDFTGFIRVAIPLDTTSEYLAQMHNVLLGSSLIGLLFLIANIIFAARYIDGINIKHHRQLEQKVLDRTHDISLIQKFGQMLTGCESIDEISDVVLAAAPSIFPDASGALSLNPPSMDHIEIIASWGEDWHPDKTYLPNDCWAFRRGSHHLSEKDALGFNCKHFTTTNPVFCVPLMAQGVSLGAIHIMAHTDTISERVQEMMLTMGEHLSLSMANVNLRNSLKHQAVRDPLTNLYNRRYLDEALPRDIRRAKRRNTNIGVMMIDVDHFKKFNDSFGHEAGDYVLQKLGAVLADSVRSEDIACRYGGEEFTLILSETDVATTAKRAFELVEKVRALNLNFKNKSLGHITLSVGIAIYPYHGDNLEMLISTADEALYIAKNEGRNQIKVAPLPPELEVMFEEDQKVAKA